MKKKKSVAKRLNYVPYHAIKVGRDSSVGIATSYGLDGLRIESRWKRDFPQPSLGPTQPSVQWVPGSFLRVKRPRSGVDHPPPISSEVKERVELYLYAPCGSSCPIHSITPLHLPRDGMAVQSTSKLQTNCRHSAEA